MYLIGLDLGQSQDYTALCVLEATGGAFASPPTFGPKYYAVRHLQRWVLGTTYPAIVQDVAALLWRPPLAGTWVPLVVDATGVGRPVVDLFRASGLPAIAVTLTGGIQDNLGDGVNVTVPKRTVVSNLVACFQSGRLKIAQALDQAPVLINELANFKLKVNLETGNESYEAWREAIHDDLVLCVGIACWYAERCFQPQICAVAGEFRLPRGYRLDG
jgi:hypothetical protein